MPEERNRIEVDRLSQLLFCPDERSRAVSRPRASPGRIEVVGDVMVDAPPAGADRARALARSSSGSASSRAAYVVGNAPPRGERRRAAARADRRRGSTGSTSPSCFPRIRARAALSCRVDPERLTLLAPLGYLDFAALASQARVIVTDSGGVQKEAYWYGVPCVTARAATEWVDTVEAGANVLVDDDPDRLVAAVARGELPGRRAAALRRRTASASRSRRLS